MWGNQRIEEIGSYVVDTYTFFGPIDSNQNAIQIAFRSKSWESRIPMAMRHEYTGLFLSVVCVCVAIKESPTASYFFFYEFSILVRPLRPEQILKFFLGAFFECYVKNRIFWFPFKAIKKIRILFGVNVYCKQASDDSQQTKGQWEWIVRGTVNWKSWRHLLSLLRCGQ